MASPYVNASSDKPEKMDMQEWEGSHCLPSTKQPIPLLTEMLHRQIHSGVQLCVCEEDFNRHWVCSAEYKHFISLIHATAA